MAPSIQSDILLILTTWPTLELARTSVQTLVEEKCAACGNIVGGLESIYRWEGKVEKSAEVLVIFKTTRGAYYHLESRIRQLHPYAVPEILGFPVGAGLATYLQWVGESCVS